jgi:hypothetical protein
MARWQALADWHYIKIMLLGKHTLLCWLGWLKGGGKLSDLYKDFGDVRDEDFRAWWGGSEQRGVKLFAEANLDVILRKIDTSTD